LKIFKATDYPLKVINFLNNKLSSSLSYQDNLNCFFDFCYAESNFFKLNIEKNSNYVVEEVISNNKKLQLLWANQEKLMFEQSNWFYEILFAQLIKFRPNVFFAHDRKCLDKDFIKKIRSSIPELKLIISWDGVDLKDINLYSSADIVFTPVNSITNNYRNLGLKSFTLPFAFEKTIINKISTRSLSADLSFVGSVYLGKGSHIQRKEYLFELMKVGFNDFNISGSCDVFDNLFSKQMFSLIKNEGFFALWEAYKLKMVSRGSLYGINMYNKFANSKIVFNSHIDLAGSNAGNIRMFEATGVGSCLLTDFKENITDYFKIDEEIVVYRTKAELIDKVSFLLKNQNKLREIAIAGQKRTLANHNYENRSKRLLEIINNNI
jgi:spore maturation protein CgeB